MSEHQTFSLYTILTSAEIKPEVYKHIIREIKSPLQQQSFQLTNDDSNSSLAFQKIPKRPNIPPPPSKGHHVHFQNNHFSRAYQSFSEDLQLGQSKHRGNPNRNGYQSFVSPLQYEINSKSRSQNNVCGGFESILKLEERTSVLLPTKSRNVKRKPIFQKKLQQKHSKTVDQALYKLKSMNQNQLVLLLQLMRDLEKDLTKLLDDKNTMQAYLPYIFQRLALQTQHSPSAIQTNQAHSNILQRLKSKNSGQVIKKLFRRDVEHKKVGQALLEKLFTSLSCIQNTISQFANKEQSAHKLAQAFDFITQNFCKQPTFKAQLSKFYNTLSIEISNNGLQFIWEGCGERNISKAEFLQGINLNHFIIRQKQGFEDMLTQKGFMRNQY